MFIYYLFLLLLASSLELRHIPNEESHADGYKAPAIVQGLLLALKTQNNIAHAHARATKTIYCRGGSLEDFYK